MVRRTHPAPARVAGDGVGADCARNRGTRVVSRGGWVDVAGLSAGVDAQWPWPGTSERKLLVKGSNLRCGPTKQVELLVEPCVRANGASVSVCACKPVQAACVSWLSHL